RARLPRRRRIDPRRQHAGIGLARLRGAARPRFRHPRRHQDAGAAGPAPPRDPVGERRDRGAFGRPCGQRDPRPHRGAAMIHPSRRAFLLFPMGVRVALFLVIYGPDLWIWSFDWGAFVLVAIATDLLLAFPRRLLRVTTVVPASMQVGERGAITVTIERTPHN